MELKGTNSIVVLLSVLSVLALGFILHIMRPILLPFFIAIFFVILLDPCINMLVLRRVPLQLAIFITILFASGLFYLLGLLIYASIESFVTEFPKYEQRMTILFEGVIKRFNISSLNLHQIDWRQQLSQISIAGVIRSIFITGVGSFFTFFIKFLLIILLIVYMLVGKRKLPGKIEKGFHDDPEKMERINNIIRNIDDQVQKYLGMKTLISFVTGVSVSIALSIIGVDFAIVWGLFAFFFNFIPNIGSIIASLFPIIVAFLQFDSFFSVLWVILSMVAIQITIGIIEPQTMGHRLNLSPLFVLMSLIFWGWLWGIGGMLLAVPFLATIKIVFENIPALKPLSIIMSQN